MNLRRWSRGRAPALLLVVPTWIVVGTGIPARAQKDRARTVEADPLGQPNDVEMEEPAECPVICGQHQACIGQRCVEMCRPSCRKGTFCSASGECEPLPQPKTPLLTEAERQRLSGAESADSPAFVFLDVGGIIGLGARLGLETGRRDAAVFRAHFLNTGIMSHAAYVENERQRFEWGFGASVGYRHYEQSSGNLRGFYLGGGLDYGVVRLRRRGLPDIAQLQHSAAPYAEFGYRWVFRSFAFGFGPTLALRYPVASTIVGTDRSLCEGDDFVCTEVRGRRLEGMMHIEVGWFQ